MFCYVLDSLIPLEPDQDPELHRGVCCSTYKINLKHLDSPEHDPILASVAGLKYTAVAPSPGYNLQFVTSNPTGPIMTMGANNELHFYAWPCDDPITNSSSPLVVVRYAEPTACPSRPGKNDVVLVFDQEQGAMRMLEEEEKNKMDRKGIDCPRN